MSAQVSVNFSLPITQSRAINTFQSIPRWPSASSDFEFNTHYLGRNILSGVIPLVVGIILSILFIVHIVIRYTCRHESTDTRQKRIQQSKLAASVQIVLSSFIIALVFVFISLGLLGNATLNFSARNSIDIMSGIVSDVSRVGYAMVDTAVYMRGQLKAFDPSTTDSQIFASAIGDFITPTLESMRDYAVSAYPDVVPLRSSLKSLIESITEVLDIIRKAVTIIYAVVLALLLLLSSAPLLLFTSDALPKRARCARIFTQIVYLLLPALLAWLLVGVTSVVGAVVSDVCVSIHDYRAVLMSTGNASVNNPLVNSGFVCPDAILPSDLRSQIDDTSAAILQSQLATSTVELMLNTSAKGIIDSADWSADQIIRLLDCSMQIDFSGKLEFVVCGHEGQSAMEGIFDLWIGFLGLAIVLGFSLIITLFGVQVASSMFVRSNEAPIEKPIED